MTGRDICTYMCIHYVALTLTLRCTLHHLSTLMADFALALRIYQGASCQLHSFSYKTPRKSKFFQPRITTVAIRAASTAKPGRNSCNGKERYREQSAVNLDLFCGPLFAASKSLPNTHPPRPNNPCSSNYLQPVQSVTNIEQSFTTNISCIYLCMHYTHNIPKNFGLPLAAL